MRAKTRESISMTMEAVFIHTWVTSVRYFKCFILRRVLWQLPKQAGSNLSCKLAVRGGPIVREENSAHWICPTNMKVSHMRLTELDL